MRFFARKLLTLSDSQIIRAPLITMAVAMTQMTSVRAMAARMESKENTRFMMTMAAMMALTDFCFLSPSP